MKKVNFFLAGAPKCGTSWIHRVFLEHPEICTSVEDTIQYFNINQFYKSDDWYIKQFAIEPNQNVIADLTPSYYRDIEIAQRIFDYNPDAKICFVFRNPIDRAFSQYWHKKSKKRITYTFNDTLERKGHGYHDLFYEFVQPGFYHSLLQPYLKLFPKENIKVMLFDDLRKDSKNYIKTILDFAGVDSNFTPAVIDKKVNSSSSNFFGKSNLRARLSEFKKTGNVYQLFVPPVDEYKRGMDASMRTALQQIYKSEIEQLSKYLGRDLSHWK